MHDPRAVERTNLGLGFGLGTLILVTIILVVVIQQAATIFAARASASREVEYRELAEKAVDLEQRSLAERELHASQLTEVTTRITSIERLLRDVE